MASTLNSSTPPPPSSIHTPESPRYGWEDNYQPYSPRKSARVSSQRSRAAQTTPPPASTHSLRASRSSPRSLKRGASSSTTGIVSSPPLSPQTASKKKVPKGSPNIGGRRVSGALNFESTTTAAAALGLSSPRKESKMDAHRSTATVRNNGMLPTPAKTPKKRPSKVPPQITSIARNLFPIRNESVEEVMPSPKKNGRKMYSGFTLDSFEAQDDEAAPIQIYTDSHDRVPEVDLSAENPFYGETMATQTEPTKRSSKRRKIIVPGEGEQTVEEVEQREDGLVYVFRGKKIFRKFADEDEAESLAQADSDTEVDAAIDETVSPRLRGPLTRSSIKPRLLFPTPEQARAKQMRSQIAEDEEEAITDIEEPSNNVSTPTDHMDNEVATPRAPKFAPASPPTTSRATRSKKVGMSSSPMAPTSDDESAMPQMRHGRGTAGKVSPFDRWQRTKSGVGAGKKREGDQLTRDGGTSSKKQRS